VIVDSRLRIGAWAALLVAILAPLLVVATLLAAHDADPLRSPSVRALGAARVAAVLVGAIGLDGLFRSIATSPARIVLACGVAGAAGMLSLDALELAGLPSGALDTILGLIAGVLLGGWFIGGGAILLSAGGDLARIGWPAELGGLGTIAAAIAIATGFGEPAGTGTSSIDWFLLLGLFVIVYLVRIWRYVVGGRLPSPGVL
jgi:hypothetical protein